MGNKVIVVGGSGIRNWSMKEVGVQALPQQVQFNRRQDMEGNLALGGWIL